MIVREKNTQINIQFQDQETFLELGDVLLKQSGLQNRIPWKRKRDNLIFEIKGYQKLLELLPSFSQNELIDTIYYCVFITDKINESGFLKKECIWCQFEHIFYDHERRKPIFLMLPVSGKITPDDGIAWNDRFISMIKQMLVYLKREYATYILNLVYQYLFENANVDEILDKIDQCGNGQSGLLVEHTKRLEYKSLMLHYSGRYGVLDIHVDKDEYIIGKKAGAVDGVVALSEAVSRIHCKIVKQSQQFFVQDLDSMNHTFVNGEYIPPFELMELNDRDILSIADVDFRVLIKTDENKS